MQPPIPALLAFFEDHRRCGALDGGMENGRIWMTCDRCDARLVLDTEEPQRPTE